MTIPEKRADRRSARTRQALRQAFMDLAREKGFAALSVQDIADRANVNRGTFYIHFEDKYALLDAVMKEEFRRHLSALPPAESWDRATLRQLVRIVLENLEGKYGHRRRLSPLLAGVAPRLERTMQEELTGLLLAWLGQGDGGIALRHVPAETAARVAAWAIFGAAAQWSQEPLTTSLDQMADDILAVVMDGLG